MWTPLRWPSPQVHVNKAHGNKSKALFGSRGRAGQQKDGRRSLSVLEKTITWNCQPYFIHFLFPICLVVKCTSSETKSVSASVPKCESVRRRQRHVHRHRLSLSPVLDACPASWPGRQSPCPGPSDALTQLGGLVTGGEPSRACLPFH